MKFFLIICGVLVGMMGCSSKYYMRRGDRMAETGRFYKAGSKYEKAYHKTKSKDFQALAAIKAGQVNQNVNRLKEAYNWLRKAERANPQMPEIYLKVAQLAVMNDDTATAREYYRKQEALFGDGKGNDGLYYLEQVDNDLREQGRYRIALKREFNSRYSDFAPVYVPGDTTRVLLASTRKPDPRKKRIKTDPVTGEGYSHIYGTRYVQEIRSTDKQGKVKVKRFKEPRWLQPELQKDSIYSNRSEGVMCFTPDGRTLYFTSSRMIKESQVGTRIYKVIRQAANSGEETEKKEWGSVSLAGICGDSVSIGHPALTPDGLRLYFVTDQLPGGFGGKDIWYVDRLEEKWGQPQNAGELINTAGDEMFPYVRENGEFYFASNGHYGFGGLDLYKVGNVAGKEVIIHLPAPLNSFADDFGIAFKPGTEDGLLTSGRSGRNDHIYRFSFIPQQLKINLLTVNTVTELPIAKVNVTVTADNGEVSYLETDSLGRAEMEVVSDCEYVFVTDHPRFLKGKGLVSTYREKADRLYELQIGMQPIEKPIVIPNIYFDVAKWELRPEARQNLEELLTILEDNPNITIELSAHTDMVGNDEANRILSEHRARAVVDYLIGKGVYWDRLEAKGYGETQPRQINEKDAREYPFFKVGEVLNERFFGRLRGEQRETALQLNRRIEFKVLRTNYKPGPNSLFNPNQMAVAAEEGTKKIGETQLRELRAVKGRFFTLQLGVFKNVPAVLNQFRVVFTEKLSHGVVRYCTGVYDTREEAQQAAAALKQKGIGYLIKEFEFSH